MKEEDRVKIEIVSGVEGECLIINDYRVSGPKSWGGGTILKSFNVKIKDIKKAIEETDN